MNTPSATPLPSKVHAAFLFLSICPSRRRARRSDGEPPWPRSSLEQATRNAALNMLRNWFNGEIELEPVQPIWPVVEPGDWPESSTEDAPAGRDGDDDDSGGGPDELGSPGRAR